MTPNRSRRRRARRARLITAGLTLPLAILLLGGGIVLAALLAGQAHTLAQGGDHVSDALGVEAVEPAGLSLATQGSEGDQPEHGTAASLSIGYTYDEAGRVTSVDYGNGTVVTYTYDAGGNLLAREISGAAPPPTPTSRAPTGSTVYLPIAYQQQ